MQKSDQVQKIILEVDGEEILGLISIDEYIVETGVVDVPGRDKIVPVSNGVVKIPPIPAGYKIGKNTATYQKFSDWFYKKETHDIVCKKVDGSGAEYARELWRNVEVSKFSAPAYTAEAPVPAAINVTFLPEDITPIKAEG
jgi:hypothetical protein